MYYEPELYRLPFGAEQMSIVAPDLPRHFLITSQF